MSIIASIQTRLRSIRKRASKNTNPKNNAIVIDGDDFWWIMNMIYQAEKIEKLEKNKKLQEKVSVLEKLLDKELLKQKGMRA